MHISPDEIIFWQYGIFKLNATIAFTWGVMMVLIISAKLVTRNLSTALYHSRWQNALEVIVITLEQQISQAGLTPAKQYIVFLGSIFLFVATANLLTIFPGYEAPTSSLSTTIALALCVFVAVPYFGIKKKGLRAYLASYTQPTMLMLPFNIIGELSRTLALAVRLFGNMMSGTMILAILLVISPLFFPILMTTLGLLTGMVQAYIFFVLASVYIAAATTVDGENSPPNNSVNNSNK